MELIQDTGTGFSIHSVEAGQININGTIYTHSLIVTPTQIIADWDIQQVSDLTPIACQTLLQFQPEIILLGTGAQHTLPDLKVIALLGQQRIGLECMNTDAACRTYNVLMAEGRNVMAALIL